jgi:hypothetical protein
MLKRTLAIAISAAFLATTTTTLVILPAGPAAAEMAAPMKESKKKSEDKSGMSGKERMAKCSAEWKEMKAAGKTAGQKWPQFYSECNKRLKGS